MTGFERCTSCERWSLRRSGMVSIGNPTHCLWPGARTFSHSIWCSQSSFDTFIQSPSEWREIDICGYVRYTYESTILLLIKNVFERSGPDIMGVRE